MTDASNASAQDKPSHAVRKRSTTGRVCSAPNCADAIPPHSRADRQYCSKQCKRRVAKRRAAARKRHEDGLDPTLTDLQQARHDAKLRSAGKLIEEGADSFVLTARSPKDVNRLNTHTTSLANSPTPSEIESLAKQATQTPTSHLEAVRQFVTSNNIGGAGFEGFVSSEFPRLLSEGTITQADIASHFEVSSATASNWVDLYSRTRTTALRAAEWFDDPEVQKLREAMLADDGFELFSETFYPSKKIPWFHKEWDQHITSSITNGQRTLLLAAQRHGKSEWLMRQCLWRIIKDPNIQIIWVGKSAKLAQIMTGWVKNQLENYEALRNTFLPPDTSFKPPARRGAGWNATEFEVATRTDHTLKSPTMVALGTGTTILGRDADLVIIDDPIDHAMCRSSTERNNVKEWFFTDFLSREEEKTAVVYIGSRQHHDDLPAQILKKNEANRAQGRQASWEVHTYRAHDLACDIPLDDHPPSPDATRIVVSSVKVTDPDTGQEYTEYVEDEEGYPWSYEATTAKCVLWPALRSPQYLAEKFHDDPAHFARNYQANPTSDAFISVTKDDIAVSAATDAYLSTIRPFSMMVESQESVRQRAKTVGVTGWNFSSPRRVGVAPPKTRLIASVDPATAKPNAAVLWAYTTIENWVQTPPVPAVPTEPTTVAGHPSAPLPVKLRAIVDVKLTDRPGTPGMRQIIREWVTKYGVRDWVFETNSFHDQIANDRLMNEVRSAEGLTFHEHTTNRNKHDPTAGVLSMLYGFRARPTKILLPATHPDDRSYLHTFITQLLQFDPEVKRGRGPGGGKDDDLVMAAWVGWFWLDKQVQQLDGNVKFDYPAGFAATMGSTALGEGFGGVNLGDPDAFSWKVG